jgi:seryl-tRNA synthetase
MIDLKLLRADPEAVRASLERRGSETDLDRLIVLDGHYRQLLAEVEEGRAEKNRATRAISAAADADRARAIGEMREQTEALERVEGELAEAREELEKVLAEVPNLVHPEAPEGTGDESCRVLRTVGEPAKRSFRPRDHLELGEAAGIIDVERAAKVSGSRFAFFLKEAALLELALVRFAFERLAPLGFVPVIPPVLVREEAMFGTGFFPTDEAQVYKTASDDLYLAGTAEVPIAAMHRDEILAPEDLPKRYVGYSTCFRREAGSYGRDVRGIIRVHQFEKVEMFSFCRAEDSEAEHELLLTQEEELFQALEIPYRVLEICAGDLAAPNYRKFDLEAWLPGADRWLEITSCSNDTDYQARRLGIRTRTDRGTELVHTLNGTALAVGRTLVALLENHQQEDGTARVPQALRPYTGFDRIGSPES